MCVHTERDGRILVPELPTYVRDRRPVLEQQRCKGVTHLVRTAPIEFGGIENPVERLADVRLIERSADHGRKHPIRPWSADLQPRPIRLPPPDAQGHLELPRQVYATALMVLG